MLILSLALLFTVAGALIYALAANPKAAEIGRLMFFAGLLGGVLAGGGGAGLRWR